MNKYFDFYLTIYQNEINFVAKLKKILVLINNRSAK